MKKIICLVLTALLLLSLCACAGSSKGEAAFQVGYARVDVTPKSSVPLTGYGDALSRMSQGFLDYLYVTCIAMTDTNGETLLLYTADQICITDGGIALVREKVCQELGIPEDKVIVATTHNHSAPELGTKYDNLFKDAYYEAFKTSAQQALEDRSPATMKAGSTKTEGMNFVRHYIMNDDTVAGDNFGDTSSGYKGHVTEPDEQLQMVRFVRQDKKDVLLVNWQAHSLLASTWNTPEGQSTRNMLSADYPGAARSYVEQQDSDVLFAYFLGASGNLNPYSMIKTENKQVEFRKYGQMLGEVIVGYQDQLTEVATGDIKTKQTIYEATIDHTEDHLKSVAQKVLDVYKETNNNGEALKAGQDQGVMGHRHATAIIRRANMVETVQTMELNAVAIGPIGFVTAPYEMFCTNAIQLKEASPYDITFVLTCTNGHHAYIADELAFTYGSYEVHNRNLVRGTAEDLVDTMVSMLKELKG